MTEKKLLIATHNRTKFSEMKELLGEIPYTVVSLADVGIDYDVEETGTTFQENAVLKAKTYSRLSGLLTLADDSGIEVKALHGEPGVRTKEYAGPDVTDEEKVHFLLKKMAHVPSGQRQAKDVTYIALAWPSGETWGALGECSGSIALEPKGSPIQGFSFRVLFMPQHSDKTLAELTKMGISTESPRARAAVLIKEFLMS